MKSLTSRLTQPTAEVKTGRRRVIDYLLRPVQESLHDSVKERWMNTAFDAC